MIKLENTPLNFLDIETTGLRLSRDRIIEIFISKELNNQTVKTFHTLINPEFIPDRYILKLTSIQRFELEDAPKFSEIADQIFEFLNEGILVAHNARFDFSFLRNEFNLLGKSLNTDYCCTMKMLKKLYPYYRKHNLDVVRKIIDHKDEVSHRAQNDTEVIRKFYYHSIENFGAEKVEETVNYSIKKSAIPQTLLKYDFRKLPESPGVYIFYGKDDYPLYVGMSNNLRRRVRDHIYSDISYSKDSLIMQQIKEIKTIPTAGVLGAALRESYLVKKLEPLYNHKLRRNRSMIKIKESFTEKGYLTIEIESQSDLNKDDIGKIIMFGQSLRSVREMLQNLAKERGLCPKLLGLGKSKGACFSHQLGYCKGACSEKVDPEEYNKIFEETFSDFKIQNWPFNEPITIIEETDNLREEMIFHNWSFLGSSIGEGESSNIDKFSFNYDTYKIMAGYLKKNLDSIQPRSGKDLDLSRFCNFF